MNLFRCIADPFDDLEARLRVLYRRYQRFEFQNEQVIRGTLSPRFTGMEKSLAGALRSFPGRYSFERVGSETYLTISAPTGAGRPQRWLLHGALFAATLLTTLWVGSLREAGSLMPTAGELLLGVPFSGAVMLILLVHELGHFFAARHHGMDVSLPFFIPLPLMPFGTAGAVIRMRSPIFSRRQLLDLGASGPIAGFLVCLPVLVAGLKLSSWVDVPPTFYTPGNSLLFSWLTHLVLGPPAEGQFLQISSLAFAGWVGLFVTAMNLMPIGQLDGGHIGYALFSRRHNRLATALFLVMLVLGWFWPGWLFWAFLILVFVQVKHPPIIDEQIGLDTGRKLIGLACFVIFILTFMPMPFMI
ncbi:MAG: site-2 protease family protein [Gemmatimonadota bacterium]|nr:site-2 protease family protein [Gemmatimonadota bacterium]